MPDGSIVARQQRAYTTLEIKSVDEEARVLTGIASTIGTDRMGDIVEPKGAVFKLPLPLLWQHNSSQPIGHVTQAKVTANGIEVVAKIAKGVAPFIDDAWALIKAGLVRGLSIGFAPIEYSFLKEGGVHFQKWDWYELSAVTIPANAEASISTIKSVDQEQRAASGNARPVVHLSSPPGASGKTSLPKGTAMKTPIAEQISTASNRRAASVARMEEVMSAAEATGSTLDEKQAEEYETLAAEVKSLETHITRLREHEQLLLKNTVSVNTAAAGGVAGNQTVSVHVPRIELREPKLEKGQEFGRWALAMAKAGGNVQEANRIVQTRWKDSRLAQVSAMAASINTADFTGHFGETKAAVAAGDTTTSGWASQLAYAQNIESEFIEYLRPRTVMGQIDAAVPFRKVPFNFRTGSMTGGTTAYWVGQGLPVPVSKPTTSSDTLAITKLAGMTVVTDELLRLSSPSVEMLVRDDLADAIAYLADTSFLDPNQGGTANVQPASITYGVTANVASGTDYAAVKTDVKAAFSGMISANQGLQGAVWVMSGTTALAMSLMLNAVGQKQFDITPTGGTFLGAPVVVSQAAYITGSPDYGNMIVLLFPREIFLADDGSASIEISNQASIQQLDNPTNQSTGSTAATTVISMFQTNSLAIKGVRYINWKVRGTRTAVGLIRTAAYA